MQEFQLQEARWERSEPSIVSVKLRSAKSASGKNESTDELRDSAKGLREAARSGESYISTITNTTGVSDAVMPTQSMGGSLSVIDAMRSADPVVYAQANAAVQKLNIILNTAIKRKQQVDTAMSQLLRETRMIRRQRRERIARYMALFALGAVLLVVTEGRILQYGVWFFILGGGTAADMTMRKRRDAARTVIAADEPRVVGVLAISLLYGDQSMRHAIERALLRLLPRVHANDIAYIDTEQMDALLDLAERGQESMQIAVLKALEQIGDQRAVATVWRLRCFGNPVVSRQAEACLPYLAERKRRAEEQNTLLRAGTPPAIDPTKLLRAGMHDSACVPVDQLLRPTQD